MNRTLKPIRQLIGFALALATTLASAQTNTPSDQFQSAVAAFQQSATEDNARKLAELLKQLDPPPALPEEAEFHAMKGAAFFNQATNAATDGAIFAKAAAEYRAASTAAPWLGDYHYNLAAAENSAGRLDAATNALKFAQIFARTDQDRRDNLALRAKIETTQEIAATREQAAEKGSRELAAKAAAATPQAREAALWSKVEGAKFVDESHKAPRPHSSFEDIYELSEKTLHIKFLLHSLGEGNTRAIAINDKKTPGEYSIARIPYRDGAFTYKTDYGATQVFTIKSDGQALLRRTTFGDSDRTETIPRQ